MAKVEARLQSWAHAAFFWTLALVGIGLLFLVVALPVIRQRHIMETMVEQMAARNAHARDAADRMHKERDALVSDPFYVEKVARERLNMYRPGQAQVIIHPATYEKHREDAEARQSVAAPVGLWRLYHSLNALAEDNILRQAALILGGLALVTAVLLFGRAARRAQAA